MSLPEPVIIGPCTLYLADCRDVAPTLHGVDATIADPPYGDTSLDWDRLTNGWQALVPSRSMWCFGSLRYFLATVGAFDGWKLAQEIVWEKQNGSSFHADRFKRVHELAVQFYRGEWQTLYRDPQYTNDATKRTIRRKKRPPHTGHIEQGHYVAEDGGPRMMRSVIYHRNCHGHAIHPTEKPIGLLEPLIRYVCPPGGLIFVPFMGSGSDCEAAIRTGRRAIACETDREHFAEAVDRVRGALRDERSKLPLEHMEVQ